MNEGKLIKTWETSAFDREKGEWTTTLNHSYDHEADDVQQFRATPAIIKPSRRKDVPKDHSSIFVFSDAQVGYRRIIDHETNEETMLPLHDERKLRTMRAIARRVLPDLIVNLGDTIDLPDWSKYDPDSDQFHRTLAPALQRIHNMYAELRADHPRARIVEVSSNHNERFNRTVLKKLPQLYNVRRVGTDSQYPAASYPYMANLEKVGVEWRDGYPVGDLIVERGVGRAALRFAHGTETSSGMSTAASKAMRANPETVNFQGHDHKDSETWHTTRSGEQIGTFVIGALCNTTGLVPGYRQAVTASGEPVYHQQNWTSSVAHLRLYHDGELEVNKIMIGADGSARYEGSVISGEE